MCARMVILFSGRGGNMVNLVRKLHRKNGIEVAAVLSNNPQAEGIAKAKALGVPVRCVPHSDYPDRAAFDAALVAALEPFALDLIALAGFMRILTPVCTDFSRGYGAELPRAGSCAGVHTLSADDRADAFGVGMCPMVWYNDLFAQKDTQWIHF